MSGVDSRDHRERDRLEAVVKALAEAVAEAVVENEHVGGIDCFVLESQAPAPIAVHAVVGEEHDADPGTR